MHHAHLVAFIFESTNRLVRCSGPGAHDDHDGLGFRRARVLEDDVPPAGLFADSSHRRSHEPRDCVIEDVGGLPGLEEDVGILSGASQHRPVGIERPEAMVGDEVFIDQPSQHPIVDELDLRYLMRGAEPIEEMEEGHTRFQRGEVGDDRHVLGFLDRR